MPLGNSKLPLEKVVGRGGIALGEIMKRLGTRHTQECASNVGLKEAQEVM